MLNRNGIYGERLLRCSLLQQHENLPHALQSTLPETIQSGQFFPIFVLKPCFRQAISIPPQLSFKLPLYSLTNCKARARDSPNQLHGRTNIWEAVNFAHRKQVAMLKK